MRRQINDSIYSQGSKRDHAVAKTAAGTDSHFSGRGITNSEVISVITQIPLKCVTTN
jgi:hypothetical protein